MIEVEEFNVDKINHRVPPDSRVKVNQNMRVKFKTTETADITYRFSLQNDMWLVENGKLVKEIHRKLEVSTTGTPVNETLTFRRDNGLRRDTYHLKQMTVDEGERETPQTVILTIA